MVQGITACISNVRQTFFFTHNAVVPAAVCSYFVLVALPLFIDRFLNCNKLLELKSWSFVLPPPRTYRSGQFYIRTPRRGLRGSQGQSPRSKYGSLERILEILLHPLDQTTPESFSTVRGLGSVVQGSPFGVCDLERRGASLLISLDEHK